MKSKNYQKINKEIDKDKLYDIDQGLALLQENRVRKFDETIEMHLKLGINPRKTEQQLKGSLILPYGSVKTKKIAVFCGEAKLKEAKTAGADLVGGVDLIEKIKTSGKCDFEIAIAEPSIMQELAKIAKVLGPKGLMPSPKTGAVTEDIKKAVEEIKKGKVNFKNDAGGNLHQPIGKLSWDKEKIKGNFQAILKAVQKHIPNGVKGKLIREIYLATTMGPSVKIEVEK